MELLGRALHGVPAIGVGLDTIADLSTEQPPHRLIQRLADYVPARHLDAGDAGHDDLPGAAVVAVLHPLHERLDVERVATENVVRGRFSQITLQRLGVAQHPCLTDADETLVGAHHNVGEVAPRCAQHVH